MVIIVVIIVIMVIIIIVVINVSRRFSCPLPSWSSPPLPSRRRPYR
jgi:hypothetical protein